MFKKALPVFAAGKEKELNYQLIVSAEADSLKGAKIYLTAVSFYRLWVNGEIAFFGPARAAKGFARVDIVDLDKYAKEGTNRIAIEVAGYACGSLATVRQPSFVQAEVRVGDEVLLATGEDFCGYRNVQRLQKVERFSVQRHFGEIWDMRKAAFCEADKVELEIVDTKLSFLPATPAPCADIFDIDGYASSGRFCFDENKPYRPNRYSWASISKEWGVFPKEEVVSRPFEWIGRQATEKMKGEGELPIKLREGEYAIVDMGKIYAGFLRLSVEALLESTVVVAFSELCTADEFEFSNINCQNVIEYYLPENSGHKLESFEPYTFRYAIVTVKSGEVQLSSFGIRKWEFDTSVVIPREIKDPELKRIYDASIRTFAHNAVDIYMDCPSRERAGWLCDSLFTARMEYFFTGDTKVEDAFLENYRSYRGNTLGGLVPECYPGDIEDYTIPQWNMWYVLESYEYLTERKPSADKEAFRESLFNVMNYFKDYENADGLLEKLPGWNFVEWSSANDWVHDVNYPTNFLYAEALERMGKLYGEQDMIEKAERVRKATIEQSFNGEFFMDQAVRDENGKLSLTGNFSEAGQYYAILFGKVDIYDPKYARLKECVMNEFSEFSPELTNFVSVDCMPGYYLKMWSLMELKWLDILERSIKNFFGGMVDLTGTIWEYKPIRRKGSYDHGFASYVALAAYIVDSNK